MGLVRGLMRGLLRGLKRGIGATYGGRATIAPSVLAENSDSVDRVSYAFAESASPAANTLLLMEVVCGHATAAEVPNSVSAYGLSWTQVSTVTHAGGNRRVTWFYAWGAAPSTGTVTIGFTTGHLSCTYAVTQLVGAALTAPPQAKTNTGTGTTITVAFDNPLEHKNNVMLYSISRVANEITSVPVSGGWAKLTDRGATAPAGSASVAWAKGQTSASPTWATSGGAGIVAIEVKAA